MGRPVLIGADVGRTCNRHSQKDSLLEIVLFTTILYNFF